MVLDEGNGGLQRFVGFGLVSDNLCFLLLGLADILAHHHIGTQIEHQTDDEADGHLSDNLVLAFQTVFLVTEGLDIIVHEAQET